MQIHVPYGRSHLSAEIPAAFGVDIIESPQAQPAADPLGVVAAALENLIGDVQWRDFAGARSVAIAVNDKTRPVPHHQLLPPLMERLASLGIPDSAITFYLAVGTHTPMPPEEFPSVLPAEILSRFRVVSHDSENEDGLTYLGETSRRTPVWVNKGYFHSDLKIVLGNIEPHQFAGFSGGVKTAAIGLTGFKTINTNHSLMAQPASKLGAYEANPTRQDIEEMGEKIGIHLAVNAILSQDRQIVHALAGSPRLVMLAGLPLSRQVCQAAVAQPYACILASPGGHPKDINLYQAQKALGHASLIARPGGTVILAAACPEGTGSRRYDEWMIGKRSYAEILDCFAAEGFRIGPHKAFQIARDGSRFRLLSCTGLDQTRAHELLLNPVSSLQAALDQALAGLQPGERIGVLPHASSTIPYLQG